MLGSSDGLLVYGAGNTAAPANTAVWAIQSGVPGVAANGEFIPLSDYTVGEKPVLTLDLVTGRTPISATADAFADAESNIFWLVLPKGAPPPQRRTCWRATRHPALYMKTSL